MDDEVTPGVDEGSRAPEVTSVPAARRRAERGAVTAEAAAVLPVLVAVTLGLVWLLSLTLTQVRVVDGAREAARLAARGESDAHATDRAARIAPPGARFEVSRGGDTVRVTVTAEVRGPGGLFSFLPGLEVGSSATATEEPR